MTEQDTPPAPWRSRITSFSEAVPAETLTAHPLNARLHPEQQQAALTGALNEIGWVQAVIVSERTGRILDGHARTELAAARNETVPVTYVDVTEEEAAILATFDPITGMAEYDNTILDALLAATPQPVDTDFKALLDHIPIAVYAVTGTTVCRMHGGTAPQVQAAAQRRLAIAEIETMYVDTATVSPTESLLEDIARSRALIALYEQEIARTQKLTQKQQGASMVEVPAALVNMHLAERKHHANITALAIKAGVEEKLLALDVTSREQP